MSWTGQDSSPELQAWFARPRCCEICGAPVEGHAHHRTPKSFRKKGKMPADWNPDEHSNLSAICLTHHQEYHAVMGVHPYMGSDRAKNEMLGRNVARLLMLNPRYLAALPDYAIEVHRMWREDRL